MNQLLKKILKMLHPKYRMLFLEYPITFQPRYGFGKTPHQGLNLLINAQRDTIESNVVELKKHFQFMDTNTVKNQSSDNDEPVWENGYFSPLDMLILYSMISTYNPKQYIEVGSGTSTKVAAKAIRKNNLSTEIISIDPQPRENISLLAAKNVKDLFENVDLTIFKKLSRNDIVFIDGSHRILPNSDVTAFLLDVLPNLPAGIIVHFHDIYLPYDYPQEMCDRFYSEQYGLAIALLSNPDRYKILLPSYFVSQDPSLQTILEPFWKNTNHINAQRDGCSFWIQIQ